MFKQFNAHLAQGHELRAGMFVDATIINASSSTKNGDGEQHRVMHQPKKGNPCYFGMTAHIGMDKLSGLIHHAHHTATNVIDVTQVQHLLHGCEEGVYDYSGYIGAEKRIVRNYSASAQCSLIAQMPSRLRAIRE